MSFKNPFQYLLPFEVECSIQYKAFANSIGRKLYLYEFLRISIHSKYRILFQIFNVEGVFDSGLVSVSVLCLF